MENTKEQRIKDFMKAYEELTKKYEIDFTSYPLFIPNGSDGSFKVVVQTSPLDLQELKKKDEFIQKAA